MAESMQLLNIYFQPVEIFSQNINNSSDETSLLITLAILASKLKLHSSYPGISEPQPVRNALPPLNFNLC